MAAQMVKAPLGGVHTAGIYADMTVDGPEIGTLVVVVDRARNLPNRKAMGKQDPYCAARLGKEARKTETDKRGGQTPKWDQELRFTVHDSPDYYQLKVSVFNDDKKTELIGECWVALDSIIVKGGAQNDMWHSLNCKGRFAGEVRMELTFYDTRPRENRMEERRQSARPECTPEPVREGIGGPRQHKPVKGRPLPAGPTGSTPPASLPVTPPVQQQHERGLLPQRLVESPDDYQMYAQYQQQQEVPSRGSLSHHQQLGQSPYDSTSSAMLLPGQSSPTSQRNHDPPKRERDGQPNDMSEDQGSQNREIYNQGYGYEHGFETDTYDSTHISYTDGYAASTPVATPPHSIPVHRSARPSPASVQPHASPVMGTTPKYHGASPSHSVAVDVSQLSSPPRDSSYEAWPRSHEFGQSDEGPPPAPPAHRTSASRMPPQAKGYRDPHSDGFASMPAPLKVRNDRGSISGSPSSLVYSVPSDQAYGASTSPSGSHRYSNPVSSIPSQTSYKQMGQQRSPSPIRDEGQPMPPSLVPGYEPSVAAEESDRILRERRMSLRQNYATHETPPHPQESASVSRSRPIPVNRGMNMVQERQAHRNSASIIKPQAVRPDLRMPMRKSVSPQPASAPDERRAADIPFSPDSFNSLNPNLDSAGGINQTGARYDTPEKAREASAQHDRDVKRGDGPIIGSDGRIIDPSDHLPTDTWAPEPEPKTPRKGPEVTVRFRHNPKVDQPMSPAGRRPLKEARPNAMMSPVYAHSAESSPASAPRMRLQKKSRVNLSQAASSPIVPTVNTTSPRIAMQRSSATDYPQREGENYGYVSNKPTNGNRSYGAVAPPVPGKVPIGRGQDDWDRDALSEEMSRIDIGVGSGYRTRTRQYGF